jgi:hypothetical protein
VEVLERGMWLLNPNQSLLLNQSCQIILSSWLRFTFCTQLIWCMIASRSFPLAPSKPITYLELMRRLGELAREFSHGPCDITLVNHGCWSKSSTSSWPSVPDSQLLPCTISSTLSCTTSATFEQLAQFYIKKKMINSNSNETARSGTRPTSSSARSSSQTQICTSCQTQISSFSQIDAEENDLAEVRFQPNARFYLAFTAISVVTLAAAIDATSLSIALPILTNELKGSAIEAFWTGTSFLITSAILMPLYAALSHIFGRKYVSQNHLCAHIIHFIDSLSSNDIIISMYLMINHRPFVLLLHECTKSIAQLTCHS